MSFRFVHTADLHLNAPLKAIALRDPDLAQAVGVASCTAFSRIVDLCIYERVAFLLISGDLWDGEHSSTKTPRFLKQELLRLEAADISCFIIRGNHDALSRQTGELDLPGETHLFGARPATVDLDLAGHRIAIHGLSFRDAQAPESLLPRYPAARPGAFNIGMMHTSLNGSPGHDNYAPASLADLDGHGYGYWALGHIHRRMQHVGRRQPFDRLSVGCSDLTDWPALLTRLQGALGQLGDTPRAEAHLVIRPVLSGVTPLAWRMIRDHDRLTEEAPSPMARRRFWSPCRKPAVPSWP